MSIKGGVSLIKKSLLSYMASRAFFWTLSFGWLMGPLIYLFVWSVAAGNGEIGGFARKDFVLYYLVLILVNQLTYPSSHWVIGESIQGGHFSVSLLRPMPPVFEAIASDIALKVVCLPFVLVVAAVLALFLGFSAGISTLNVLLFVFSLVLAQILRFTVAYAIALLAFWTQKIDSLLSVHDTLVFLLAGQAAPIALIPGVLGTIARFLPYRYMLGFPVELLMGKLSGSETLYGIITQLCWVVLAVVSCRLIWKTGVKRYSAVGG
ncbi:MAG: ABC-2 family transporter protein [Clostridia bacterium]|nr:ABC-2 family transporter protein [Clostridia bacterium]